MQILHHALSSGNAVVFRVVFLEDLELYIRTLNTKRTFVIHDYVSGSMGGSMTLLSISTMVKLITSKTATMNIDTKCAMFISMYLLSQSHHCTISLKWVKLRTACSQYFKHSFSILWSVWEKNYSL